MSRVCLQTILICVFSTTAMGTDAPIVLDSAAVIDGATPDIRYYGQPAKDGKIDLTATNGFFDDCFVADEQQAVIPGDEPFINCSFGCLAQRGDQATGTARWHLWCPEAGEIKAAFSLRVPAGEANHPWTIKVGDESQPLKVNASDGQSPQEKTLTFTVKHPGKVTIAIDCTQQQPPPEARICRIRLSGGALTRASLLRVRWRPSAVHQRFVPATGCPGTHMWVFETRSVTPTSSYSPITTPFGYFGTSFDSEGRVSPGAGFNFSMWIAGSNATDAPPIAELSHLIATSIPGAEYSSFGGEGTGVKFRDAIAYKDGADRVIQALRVETEDGLNTFYGYFYDEHARHWRLYASAQQPKARRAKKKDVDSAIASPGSFCEIPGPPARQRSGDVVREIKHRGWFFGSDRKWYPALINPGRKPEAEVDEKTTGFTSRRVFYMDDFHSEGWIAMATGGMENYISSQKQVVDDTPSPALPEYLTAGEAAELFEVPVVFGMSKELNVSSDSAIVEYEIEKTGSHSKAILYYGTVDCLTFTPRELIGGSPVEKQIFSPERTWQSATPEQDVAMGANQFKISGLKPGTTYYFRLFVSHVEGKSWDYRSGSFKTPR